MPNCVVDTILRVYLDEVFLIERHVLLLAHSQFLIVVSAIDELLKKPVYQHLFYTIAAYLAA